MAPTAVRGKKGKKIDLPPLPREVNRISKRTDLKEFLDPKGIYNLAVIGHSQVKNLSKLDKRSIAIDAKLIRIKYFHSMGSTYGSIMRSRAFQDMWQYQPHFIVVWIAGNEVGSSKCREEIKQEMETFYQALRDEFPMACLISTQVEDRFYEEENDYGAPTGEEWRLKRQCINNHLNKKLHDRDYLITLAGSDGLDDSDAYYDPNDFIHLNEDGLEKFFTKLEGVVKKIFDEIKERQYMEVLQPDACDKPLEGHRMKIATSQREKRSSGKNKNHKRKVTLGKFKAKVSATRGDEGKKQEKTEQNAQ